MTRNNLDDTTRRALLGLDPAPANLDATDMKRAEESLARILTVDPDRPGISGYSPPTPRRMRRVALLGALAIVTAVAVVGTQLFGGGSPAYASWTATPHAPTTAQEMTATSACRESLLAQLEETPQSDPGGVTRSALRQASAVLAEQRGDWTLVVLGDSGGFDASCVAQNDGSSTDNSWEASGYRESLNLGPRDILVSSGGTGGSRNNLMSVLIGFVGTDVTGVTVHTAEHDDVMATVTNGHVAAWWPGPRGVSVSDPQLGTAVDATVTYSDGTTEERRLDVGPNPG